MAILIDTEFGRRVKLSRREQEVGKLIVRGCTRDKAIADKLKIAKSTAAGHVARMIGRAGLINRVELALWIKDNPESLKGLPVAPGLIFPLEAEKHTLTAGG